MKRLAKLLLCLLVLTMAFSVHAEAKSTTRYTTKDVKVSSDVTLKMNTKVTYVKAGKTWAHIEYKGQKYKVKKIFLHEQKAVNKWKGKSFKNKGRGKWKKWSYTWYSSRQLSGKGLKIPGRHVDKKRGFILDKDGYICLASGVRNKKKHIIVPTPFGRFGKVYDTNGRNNNKWFDVYTNW